MDEYHPLGLNWMFEPGQEKYLKDAQDGALIHNRVVAFLGTVFEQGGLRHV